MSPIMYKICSETRHYIFPSLPVEFQDDGLDLRGRHRGGGGGHDFHAAGSSGGVPVDSNVIAALALALGLENY